jgi:hypothetical protein
MIITDLFESCSNISSLNLFINILILLVLYSLFFDWLTLNLKSNNHDYNFLNFYSIYKLSQRLSFQTIHLSY